MLRLAAMVAAALSMCAGATAAAAQPRGAETYWEPDCDYSLEGGEDPRNRETLWTARMQAEPICLLAGATAWARHDKERSARLYALANVRRYYDIGRCQQGAYGPFSSMMAALGMSAGEKLREAGVLLGLEQIRTVAMDEETYRYRTDHLRTMCDGAVKPTRAWPAEQAKIKAEVEAAARQAR